MSIFARRSPGYLAACNLDDLGSAVSLRLALDCTALTPSVSPSTTPSATNSSTPTPALRCLGHHQDARRPSNLRRLKDDIRLPTQLVTGSACPGSYPVVPCTLLPLAAFDNDPPGLEPSINLGAAAVILPIPHLEPRTAIDQTPYTIAAEPSD